MELGFGELASNTCKNPLLFTGRKGSKTVQLLQRRENQALRIPIPDYCLQDSQFSFRNPQLPSCNRRFPVRVSRILFSRTPVPVAPRLMSNRIKNTGRSGFHNDHGQRNSKIQSFPDSAFPNSRIPELLIPDSKQKPQL